MKVSSIALFPAENELTSKVVDVSQDNSAFPSEHAKSRRTQQVLMCELPTEVALSAVMLALT